MGQFEPGKVGALRFGAPEASDPAVPNTPDPMPLLSLVSGRAHHTVVAMSLGSSETQPHFSNYSWATHPLFLVFLISRDFWQQMPSQFLVFFSVSLLLYPFPSSFFRESSCDCVVSGGLGGSLPFNLKVLYLILRGGPGGVSSLGNLDGKAIVLWLSSKPSLCSGRSLLL